MIQPLIMKGKQGLIKDNHNNIIIIVTQQDNVIHNNCTPIIEVNCAIFKLIITK